MRILFIHIQSYTYLHIQIYKSVYINTLFMCYESNLPGVELDVYVGVGWYGDEVRVYACNHIHTYIHIFIYIGTSVIHVH
jgi:hypothetical protein